MKPSAVDAPRKRLLSVEETAAYLGLAPHTIYNRIAPRAKDPFPVKPKRVGKRCLFDIRDLDRFVDSLQPEDDEVLGDEHIVLKGDYLESLRKGLGQGSSKKRLRGRCHDHLPFLARRGGGDDDGASCQ